MRGKKEQRPAAYQLDTIAAHTGRWDFDELEVHAAPIDLSTTYPLADLESAGDSLDALVAGDATASNPVYARLFNPTVARFEGALAELEGATDAVAYSSGMAALTAALIAAGQHGRHIVAVRPLYGTSDHLLASPLLGLETTWATPETIADAIRHDTALVIVETPANPTVRLIDIADVVRQAGDVPVLVDSTFATPVLQRPLDFGATMVLHSATKFLGGHGDVIGGVIATNDEWAHQLRQVRVVTGSLLHPLAAYLLLRSLPTLPMRVHRAQHNARRIARQLNAHPAITRVWYPEIGDGDPRELLGRQMSGPGSLIAFEVAGGRLAAADVMRRVELITPAVSLGSTDTLIQHPAGLTHRVVDPVALAEAGVTEGMLRLSLGIENADDVWHDLAGALDTSTVDVESRYEAPLVSST